MREEAVDYHMIDCLLNQKPENNKIPRLNEKSTCYLEKIKELYYSENKDKIEKYKQMLKIAGEDSVTKICRDIRQCIINLQRKPYLEEYDNSERELGADICYINTIIGMNKDK